MFLFLIHHLSFTAIHLPGLLSLHARHIYLLLGSALTWPQYRATPTVTPIMAELHSRNFSDCKSKQVVRVIALEY